MAKTVILDKDDINNPLHPDMWERLMENLDLPENTTRIEMSVVVTEFE